MSRSTFAFCFLPFAFCLAALPAPRPRARAAGIPFEGTPGPKNAITDVAGVEVGHSTIISGDGKLVVGSGPVRTGVTAILPRGKESVDPVFAAWFSLNGNGEMTGTTWVEESGFLEGPVMITNTHSVGVVRDAVIKRRVDRSVPGDWWALPVVAETWDGDLNDINGLHVKPQHAFEALDTATSGAVAEGNVGGGTGMICFEFKGGIGTASRKLEAKSGGYTLGVLVQCNCGRRTQLRIAGATASRRPTTSTDGWDSRSAACDSTARARPRRWIRRSRGRRPRSGSTASRTSPTRGSTPARGPLWAVTPPPPTASAPGVSSVRPSSTSAGTRRHTTTAPIPAAR